MPASTFKIVVLGPKSAGKTQFIGQYLNQKFSTSHIRTLGMEQKIKQTVIENDPVDLRIWELPDLDAVGSAFFYDAEVYLICVDLNQYLESAKHQVQECLDKLSDSEKENKNFILVGTKSDIEPKKPTENSALLPELPESPRFEINDLGQHFNFPAIAISAKNKVNIDAAFELVKNLLKPKLSKAKTNAVDVNAQTIIAICDLLTNPALEVQAKAEALGEKLKGSVPQDDASFQDVLISLTRQVNSLETKLQSFGITSQKKENLKNQFHTTINSFLTQCLPSLIANWENRDNFSPACEKVIKDAYKDYEKNFSKILKEINSDSELTSQDRGFGWFAKNLFLGIACTVLFPLGLWKLYDNVTNRGNFFSCYTVTDTVDNMKKDLNEVSNIMMTMLSK